MLSSATRRSPVMESFDWGSVWNPLAVLITAILAFFGGTRMRRASADKARAESKHADAETIKGLVEAAVSLVGVTRKEYNEARDEFDRDLGAVEARSEERLAGVQLQYEAKLRTLAQKVTLLERANAWYRAYNQKLIVQLHTAGLVPEWMDTPEPDSILED